MTEQRALRRAELALAALGLTTLLLAVIVAVDAVRFHGLRLDLHVALGTVGAVVIARAGVSLTRQLVAHRAFLRQLPVLREARVHGYAVRVVPGRGLQAFCAGLLRPAVYASEGALAAGGAEVRAILAHEEQHRRRRDPLRLLLARAAGDSLRPLPPFARLAEREATLADLAADAASVEELGDRAPLASAMVRFEAVAPERVDRLVGTLHLPAISRALLLAAATVSVAIATLAVTIPVSDLHPDMAVLLVGTLPALLAARRAGVYHA